MYLDKEHYDNIEQGRKIYELRIFDKKRQQYKLKDTITFHNRDTNDTINLSIIELTYFNDFSDALHLSNLKQILPDIISVDDAIKLYYGLPHKEFKTYESAEKHYGVIRIQFEHPKGFLYTSTCLKDVDDPVHNYIYNKAINLFSLNGLLTWPYYGDSESVSDSI
jgi:ASC-1-like (ASCH) protein